MIFFFFSIIFQSTIASTISLQSNTSEQHALLSFKSLISDSHGTLDSWNNTLHYCKWRGVTCNHQQRVISLELDNFNITGSISPHLANLTNLRRLHLSTNHLHGHIPQELGRLADLQSLNVSVNSLNGEIPLSLSNCSNLLSIRLGNNMLSGVLPAELGVLSKLQVLSLSENTLSGGIPSDLGNISSLTGLYLYDDGLEGRIPDALGKLTSLRIFQVGGNNLSGEIPPSLYNISSIQFFTAGNNQLVGSLPPSMFQTLPNLQMLILNDNILQGFIPVSLPNATDIVELDLKGNKFTGTVPSELGHLQNLYWLNLGMNQLEARSAEDWKFFTSLSNCSLLGNVGLELNRFSGELPDSIANLSARLDGISIAQNQISGSIPEGIGNLVNLTVFLTNNNRLTGDIPSSIGKLKKLHVLDLSGNKYSGSIPSSIGNLSQLIILHFEASGLSGSIPVSLGSCKSLLELNLSDNDLTGAIPKELLSLSSLSTYVNLSKNMLSGPLPEEISRLKSLGEFDISENRIAGQIPSAMGDCQSLERLFMGGNLFQGGIPESLSKLKGLIILDLSRNNLSGHIPGPLGSLRVLLYLNLSYNNLEGEVPADGVFANMSAVSFIGNSRLCGNNQELNLTSCYTQSRRKKHLSLALKIIIPVITAVVSIILLIFIFVVVHWMKNSQRRASEFFSGDQFMRVSYAELCKATDGFSSSNVIGVGGFGSVYKGTMGSDEKLVAVKVLDLKLRGASKGFMAECEALRNIRHRNLVKIITSCSSVDHQGNDFKALVLEFMPNGNLEKWLHPEPLERKNFKVLSLMQRLDIAIDVASALDYLHNHGHKPVVHCDLKPSNVLLDDDMCAHVADFGLAKVLSETVSQSIECSTSSLEIKGSIGYVAPEYGIGGQIGRKVVIDEGCKNDLELETHGNDNLKEKKAWSS
ncbi:hypothetical protein J5N97_006427 [Dioscorea zingiberensis]|uniref:non-specific serine/threonine protein kinase n=1 Tax=Dioscorea zingiberensis TaxID=325984 RepID=A0A9D5DA13_9LILI|nr:hypothetical protein J5N97_006427 [Dioscorea zingiberensis]